MFLSTRGTPPNPEVFAGTLAGSPEEDTRIVLYIYIYICIFFQAGLANWFAFPFKPVGKGYLSAQKWSHKTHMLECRLSKDFGRLWRALNQIRQRDASGKSR